jgi:hypothetical protein
LENVIVLATVVLVGSSGEDLLWILLVLLQPRAAFDEPSLLDRQWWECIRQIQVLS